MFDLFRSRAKAVRYLLGALLMIVAASMVVTLIPGYGSGGRQQDLVIAEIGKESVTIRDVQQQMQAAMRNKAFPAEMATYYASQMIDNMITTRALTYEATRMGVQVTDADLARALRANFPQLFPGGQFIGKEAYASILQQQGMSIPEFESQIRQQLLIGRMTGLASDSVIVTPDEIAQEFRRRNEKAKLEYVALSSAKYKDEAKVTPEQIRSYFEQNRAEFRTPEKRSFDMLVADEAKLGQKITISDADLRKIYDQNKDQFRVPERVHARHILLKTTGKPNEEIPKIQAQAENLLKQIKAGADFAELAKKNSEDPGSAAKGGDLGWIVRGQTVPAFESTAFSLKPKDISGVVKTEYGFHILQVLEKEDAHLKPFEEVKDQIAQERKRQQVFDMMQRVMDQAHDELAKQPQKAAEIANRLDLTLIHVDKSGPGDQVPEFGNNPDFREAVSALQKGGVTQVMQAPGNKLAVAVVTDVIPGRPSELSEVEGQIRNALANSSVTNILEARAKEALEKAKASNGDLKKVAQQMGLELKTTQEFGQDGAADGIGPASLLKAAFEQPVGSVFGPVAMGDQRFVCKIENRIPPEMSKLDASRAEIRAAIKERKSRERVELFMDSVRTALTREGKVKVHTDVMNRVIAGYRT